MPVSLEPLPIQPYTIPAGEYPERVVVSNQSGFKNAPQYSCNINGTVKASAARSVICSLDRVEKEKAPDSLNHESGAFRVLKAS